MRAKLQEAQWERHALMLGERRCASQFPITVTMDLRGKIYSGSWPQECGSLLTWPCCFGPGGRQPIRAEGMVEEACPPSGGWEAKIDGKQQGSPSRFKDVTPMT